MLNKLKRKPVLMKLQPWKIFPLTLWLTTQKLGLLKKPWRSLTFQALALACHPASLAYPLPSSLPYRGLQIDYNHLLLRLHQWSHFSIFSLVKYALLRPRSLEAIFFTFGAFQLHGEHSFSIYFICVC